MQNKWQKNGYFRNEATILLLGTKVGKQMKITAK